jgi:hypothetical protein
VKKESIKCKTSRYISNDPNAFNSEEVIKKKNKDLDNSFIGQVQEFGPNYIVIEKCSIRNGSILYHRVFF